MRCRLQQPSIYPNMPCRSGKGGLADAIRYAGQRREALTRSYDDARREADNNRAGNCLRPVALGRRNYLFAGSDKGGERATAP